MEGERCVVDRRTDWKIVGGDDAMSFDLSGEKLEARLGKEERR
jgi:hypothetical protein